MGGGAVIEKDKSCSRAEKFEVFMIADAGGMKINSDASPNLPHTSGSFLPSSLPRSTYWWRSQMTRYGPWELRYFLWRGGWWPWLNWDGVVLIQRLFLKRGLIVMKIEIEQIFEMEAPDYLLRHLFTPLKKGVESRCDLFNTLHKSVFFHEFSIWWQTAFYRNASGSHISRKQHKKDTISGTWRKYVANFNPQYVCTYAFVTFFLLCVIRNEESLYV